MSGHITIKSEDRSIDSLGSALAVFVASPQELQKSIKPSSRLSLGGINRIFDGKLKALLKREGFTCQHLKATLMRVPNYGVLRAVAIIGWNPPTNTYDIGMDYARLGAEIYRLLDEVHADSVALASSVIPVRDKYFIESFYRGLSLKTYAYSRYKSERAKPKKIKIILCARGRLPSKTVSYARAVAHATSLARDLVNTPPNYCQPKHLASTAKRIAKENNLRTKIYDQKRLKQIGANGILAVSAGSDSPPYLINIVYKPRGARGKPIALIGKGVTFDSGGLSIKPGASMYTMKCDMAGAAAVLGVMSALREVAPNREVRAYIPTVENMINGKATRCGDIYKALNGKTVEVLNTDAEGRLILGDAISLAVKEGCDTVIDLATLTGACVVALGPDYAGLFSNDDALAEKILASSEASIERMWRLPLAEEYVNMLKSDVADIKNIGGRWGGAITAALFLKSFLGKKTKWAHIDIAGPAFRETSNALYGKGATGFGVATMLKFLSQL